MTPVQSGRSRSFGHSLCGALSLVVASFLGGCGDPPADAPVESAARPAPPAGAAAAPAQPPANVTTPTASTPPPRSSGPLPEAQQLVELAINAQGGRQNLLSGFTTLTITGVNDTMVGGITFEEFYGRPDQFLIRRTMPNGGEATLGSDGKVGWQRIITGETQLMEAAAYDENRLALTHFQTLPRLEQRFSGLRTVEETTFAERPCFKVQMQDAAGVTFFLYFDVESRLLRGAEERRRNVRGEDEPKIFRFLEYKQFGPLTLWAKAEMESHGRKQHTYTVNEVVFDEVQPSVFELPENVRQLIGNRAQK